LHHDIAKNPIRSASKILISGLGADEIFGGYSRYRNAFLRKGLLELYLEM
jgi:asparagine synthetase B (glutamine-hydrolysing)